MTTKKLETPGADIVYDVHGRLPTPDGSPASFYTLASHFSLRTVIT
ncbi:MAG TPA: hypothetical protein VND96_07120 [Candidatus Micrarchaeaceae archaeon]|nr:hypothetical protein [Candidatus Micrarchaeaceae archaeon]